MCFFKKELLTTYSIKQKSKVLDLLSQNNIKYTLKTKDNFGGDYILKGDLPAALEWILPIDSFIIFMFLKKTMKKQHSFSSISCL